MRLFDDNGFRERRKRLVMLFPSLQFTGARMMKGTPENRVQQHRGHGDDSAKSCQNNSLLKFSLLPVIGKRYHVE